MKTKLHTPGLKRIVLATSIVALLGIGISAQPNAENSNSEMASFNRLEKTINAATHSLKYFAPISLPENEAMLTSIYKEADEAFRNLELSAGNTELKLQYRSPIDNVEEAIQKLEVLAADTEDKMQYRAPADEEQLASKEVKSSGSGYERYNKPVQVESLHNIQDTWLINAGYYKSTRTPAWSRVKKIINSKRTNRELASE